MVRKKSKIGIICKLLIYKNRAPHKVLHSSALNIAGTAANWFAWCRQKSKEIAITR